MNHNTRLSHVAIAALLAGCAAQYQPLRVDDKTGFYPTTAQVNPKGVQVYDTAVGARDFRYVVLIADTNLYPSGFVFTVRNALAQSGITRVYSLDEFKQLSRDRGFAIYDGVVNRQTISRFSSSIAPVLVVDFAYRVVAEGLVRSSLTVSDGRNEKALLKVVDSKVVWSNFDTEALYPMLNQLRKWIKDSEKNAI